MNVGSALTLMINLLTQAARVGAMISRAQAEGRDSLTDQEVDELAAENDRAREELQDVLDGTSINP